MNHQPIVTSVSWLVGWLVEPVSIKLGGSNLPPIFWGGFKKKKKMVELTPTEKPGHPSHVQRNLSFIFKIHHGKSLHFPFQILSFFWANPQNMISSTRICPPFEEKKTRERHSSHTQRRNKKFKKTLKAAYILYVFGQKKLQLAICFPKS